MPFISTCFPNFRDIDLKDFWKWMNTNPRSPMAKKIISSGLAHEGGFPLLVPLPNVAMNLDATSIWNVFNYLSKVTYYTLLFYFIVYNRTRWLNYFKKHICNGSYYYINWDEFIIDHMHNKLVNYYKNTSFTHGNTICLCLLALVWCHKT